MIFLTEIKYGWMGLDGMVIIGRRYCASTFGANKDHRMDHCQKYSVCDCYYMEQDSHSDTEAYKWMIIRMWILKLKPAEGNQRLQAQKGRLSCTFLLRVSTW